MQMPRRKDYPPKTLETTMPFGQYKGKSIAAIIEEDGGYLWWCIDNVDGFELDNEAYSALNTAMPYTLWLNNQPKRR